LLLNAVALVSAYFQFFLNAVMDWFYSWFLALNSSYVL